MPGKLKSEKFAKIRMIYEVLRVEMRSFAIQAICTPKKLSISNWQNILSKIELPPKSETIVKFLILQLIKLNTEQFDS